MIAVSEPKTKKSYHSKTVPAADAVSTRPMRCGRGCAVMSVMSAVSPPCKIASGGIRGAQASGRAARRRFSRSGGGLLDGVGGNLAAVGARNLAGQHHLGLV